MFIRCWGSRGSIPVSGKDYLKYGGDTTCMEIRSQGGALVVVDAGTGIRCFGNALVKEPVQSLDLLFTHAHWDHMIGFPFFSPIYRKGYKITIHGCTFSQRTFRDVIAGFMQCPYFPVTLDDPSVQSRLSFKTIADKSFKVDTLRITPVPLNHPKDGGKGFKFVEDGKTFVFLTDNELDYKHNGGLRFDEYAAFCHGADFLIHDAEYTQKDYVKNRSWGHSLFTDAVELGLAAGVKRLGLFHLNNRRTDKQVDDMVAQSRRLIARKGSSMACFAVGAGFKTTL